MKNAKIMAGMIVLLFMLAPGMAAAVSQAEKVPTVPAPEGLTGENPAEEESGDIVTPETAPAGPEVAPKAKKAQNQTGGKGETRRSKVANAVQAMLAVAGRQGGIGEQIRVIARAQNDNQDKIESALERVKNRGRLKKFFFGPDYRNLATAEERVSDFGKKLAELKALAAQITDGTEAGILSEQIGALAQAQAETEKEIAAAGKGFSLFGWFNKLLKK